LGGTPTISFRRQFLASARRTVEGVPKTIALSSSLRQLIQSQDGVVTRSQLCGHGLDSGFIYRQVRRGSWSRLLPGVVMTNTGEPTRRQRLIGGWLWAGPSAAVDGASACHWYGLQLDQFRPDVVHVAVPHDCAARTQGFVVVRRAGSIEIGGRAGVPYVAPATAVLVAARSCRSEKAAIALLSRALQTGLVSVEDLARARECIGDKWCGRLDGALVAVGVGIRSPAENDNRRLILTSQVLLEPLWNQWLDLGDGLWPVCADALWLDAGFVEEVNGREYHAWARQFESTEARRARQVAAGLVVQGCTPTQLRLHGPQVLRRLERTYVRHQGRGLPAGVKLIDPPANRA